MVDFEHERRRRARQAPLSATRLRPNSRPLWRCRSCSSSALGSTAEESPHAPHARPWELPPRLRADPVYTSPHANHQRRSATLAAPAPLQMP